MIYWDAPAHHKMFLNNNLRLKFTLCLESILRKQTSCRLIRIKEIWKFDNEELVNNNEMTPIGIETYWRAVDASIKFNLLKREQSLKKGFVKKISNNEVGPSGDMEQFFCEKKVFSQ